MQRITIWKKTDIFILFNQSQSLDIVDKCSILKSDKLPLLLLRSMTRYFICLVFFLASIESIQGEDIRKIVSFNEISYSLPAIYTAKRSLLGTTELGDNYVPRNQSKESLRSDLKNVFWMIDFVNTNLEIQNLPREGIIFEQHFIKSALSWLAPLNEYSSVKGFSLWQVAIADNFEKISNESLRHYCQLCRLWVREESIEWLARTEKIKREYLGEYVDSTWLLLNLESEKSKVGKAKLEYLLNNNAISLLLYYNYSELLSVEKKDPIGLREFYRQVEKKIPAKEFDRPEGAAFFGNVSKTFSSNESNFREEMWLNYFGKIKRSRAFFINVNSSDVHLTRFIKAVVTPENINSQRLGLEILNIVKENKSLFIQKQAISKNPMFSDWLGKNESKLGLSSAEVKILRDNIPSKIR